MDEIEERRDFDLFAIGIRADDGELGELVGHEGANGHHVPDRGRRVASRLPRGSDKRYQPSGKNGAAQS